MNGSDHLSAPFSYQCNRCNRCCKGRTIRLNPYEIARLADCLSLSTGQVIEDHTVNGIALRRRESDDTCVFLGPNGCTVHKDRPGACRTYPLGYLEHSDGTQTVVRVRTEPDSAGVFGTEGTVEGYWSKQGVQPYFEAARRYRQVLDKLTLVVASNPNLEVEGEVALGIHPFDIDAELEVLFAQSGEPLPVSVEDKVDMHISLLEQRLEKFGAT